LILMCGIAGILNSSNAGSPEQQALRRMLGTIRHRGPDEFGLFIDDQIALGSARLSIVDLAGGQQPIRNEDGTLWIVFNGEIFNYVELRAELEERGHQFTTHSDTEVILHLFEDLDVRAFARLNGQWALAIWDTKKRRLVLARDRLGVRPLFYWRSSKELIFASEVKAVLAHPAVSSGIDASALSEVFVYWSTLGKRSLFRGVQQLQPGHYAVIEENSMIERPFWRMGFPPLSLGDTEALQATPSPSYFPQNGTTEAYAQALRELLLDATRIRLRADVPVGAYLSGGLDSSIIAACVRELAVSKLDTFSIAFQHPDYDESAFQKQMSRALGTQHQVAFVKNTDIAEVFPAVIWHSETPLMRTAPAPMFLLSRLVRKSGYKVVLTGEGADEFLGGYDIFKEAVIRTFWSRQPESKWRPRLLQRLYPDIQRLSSANESFVKAFFGRGLTETDNPFYSHAIRWFNNERCCRFLSPDICQAAQAPGLVPPADFNSLGSLEKAQYWEITVFLSQYLLSSQGDRMGMANSIEGRFPFLDFRVVDFASRLPARLKLHGLTEKYILRKAFKDLLPPEIGSRPKRPYRAPIHTAFMGSDAPQYVDELLSESALKRSGFFNAAAVSQLVAKLKAGKSASETDEMALTGIISTQLLAQEFTSRIRSSSVVNDSDNVKVVRRRTADAPVLA
jgi:asparagine synthase (glutamine-hydrolysing)